MIGKVRRDRNVKIGYNDFYSILFCLVEIVMNVAFAYKVSILTQL